MLPANIVCLVALTLFAGLMLWAAASDFRRYLIPNQVSLGALGLFPVYVLSAPAPVQWQWSLAIAAVLFAIAFVMYLLRAFGAGDAKLLPVVVLWVGPKNFTLFILVLAVSSVVLAGIVGLRAAVAQMRSDSMSKEAGGAAAVELSSLARMRRAVSRLGFLKIKLPYGVAIASGGIAVAVNTMFTLSR
jgi:prepilin peptidase CpaA